MIRKTDIANPAQRCINKMIKRIELELNF